MKTGVVSLSLGFMDFLDMLRFVKGIGGETIEISTADGVHNKTLDWSDDGRISIKDAVKNMGLSIVSVAGYSDFTLTDADLLKEQAEGLEWYCQLAADLGVKFVRVMGGNAKEGMGQEEMVDNIIAGFRQVTHIAEKHGVIMALENHGTVVNDGPTLVKIIESVNSPNLRITMDTGNFCWAGHSLNEAYDYFRQVAPYAANVHLKDFVFEDNNEVKFVPLGEGVLDLRIVRDILVEAGYDGAMLCEYEGMGDPRVLIAEGIFTQDQFVSEIESGTERSLVHLRNVLGV
ncbi:MAG: sugar phosphate isomerase/epimerase [Firmicutes bacterium]|nr:sugar phosphate isomerase/epimerase [Bacillota bacterium]